MTGTNLPGKLWFAAAKKVKERDYWLAKLAACPVKSSFPYDHAAHRSQAKFFQAVDFSFSDELSTRLLKLSTGSDVRLFIILTTGLIILLHKYSGCENKDIIVGAPVAKASSQGELINRVLVLRNQIAEHITFKELLFKARQAVIEADEQRNYPYELLAQQLNLPPGHGELFDVAAALENIHDRTYLDPVKPNAIFSFSRTGRRISGQVEYNSCLYERSTIERIIGHFENLMQTVQADATSRVADLDMITQAEQEWLLAVFNDTKVAYPRDKLIHEIFTQQQERNPDAVAVAAGRAVLTYEQLNRQADELAELLHRCGVASGMPVGIFLERSIEMVVAVLGILKAGGAYLPIDTAYPKERIRFMLADSRMRLLVTTRTWSPKIEKPANLEIETLFIEDRKNEPCFRTCLYPAKTDAPGLAYIMYTSGSTGRPKGVMVEHRNVIRLVINTNFVALSPATCILQTGAPVFDAATFEIWGALLNGGRLYLVDNDTILNARKLAEAIETYKINTLWLSSPLFNQLMQQDDKVCAKLKYLLVGGDVLSPLYIDQARRKNKELKIINGYGPTENTTFSSTYSIDRDFVENIPIGKPINNSTAYILDKNGNLQPIGAYGELAVGGDGLSRGYLNNPELTAEKFIFNNRSYKSYFPDKVYLTGDLCRRLPDGNIEFKGRVDNQVKIRGFRVECGEIEKNLLKYERVKEAIVTIKNDNAGEKYLCAYITLTPHPREDSHPDDADSPIAPIRDFLARSIPDYMIPHYIIALEKMPLNPNGKIDRNALPEPGTALAGDAYTPPRNAVEKRLTVLWAEVLGNAENSIGIDADFFEIGGHSLKAARLVTLIHKEFDVNLPLADVFTHPTIREMSAYLSEAAQDRYVTLTPVEKREYYDVSSSQKRLYLLQQWDEQAIAYNIPAVFEIAGEIDREKLADTFRRLIERHESFRTSFHLVNGQPVQKIHQPGETGLLLEVASQQKFLQGARGRFFQKEPPERRRQMISSFIRPFDLAYAPLVRVGLIEMANTETLLAIDMHHIISDGSSMPVLVHDFMEIYSGRELPMLKIQYKDFSGWQKSLENSETLKRQETYWLMQFTDETPALNLYTDYPRPPIQSFAGAGINFAIDRQSTRALKKMAQQTGATLYMVLFGCFAILLSKISSQEDIVIGTVAAGRKNAELAPLIGMFVDTLAIRNFPNGGLTVNEFIGRVKERVLDALANQDYPYEELVERLQVRRETSRNPLFDAMFVLQDFPLPAIETAGLQLQPYPFDSPTAKFDISLTAVEIDEGVAFTLEYGSKLFKPATCERMIDCFKNVIYDAAANPGKKLAELEIISAKTKKQILYDYNAAETGNVFPAGKMIHEIFAGQVQKTPDHIALVFEDIHLSYCDLDKRAADLADSLMERGARPQDIAALMLERSPGMIIGMLAVLKTGGVYLPLSLQEPQERKILILKDSRPGLLLVQGRLMERYAVPLSDYVDEIIHFDEAFLDAAHPNDPGEGCSPPIFRSRRGAPAYLVYTSGTTGTPKGVPVMHRNVINMVEWYGRQFDVKPGVRVLQTAEYTFDASVEQIFGSLLHGARLYIIPRHIMPDIEAIWQYIEKMEIHIIDFVPIVLNELLGNRKKLKSIRIAVSGSDRLEEEVKEKILAKGYCLYNLYGPSETTVDALASRCSQDPVNLGRPIANVFCYVLDKYDNILPHGVPGELVISGAGVTDGYLNAPGLTWEKFKNDPFRPGKRMYRSGDLARWSPEGNIEFLGRIDHQVKIRGFRIELGEIEKRILEYENIKEAAVIDRQRENGEKYLCAYITALDKTAETDLATNLKSFLARHLPDYMIPPVFVTLERMPLNANKKIDRKALPEPQDVARGNEYTPPRDEVEKKLAALWLEVLPGGDTVQHYTRASQIGAFSDFFEAGGHSLYILKLVNAIQREFSVKIGFQDIFRSPKLQAQAELIRSKRPGVYEKIESLEQKEYYELSYYQKRLWLLNRFDPDSAAFNLGGRIILNEQVDEAIICRVLDRLIDRHEAFRTYFKTTAGEVKQFTRAKAAVDLERVDLSQLPTDEREDAGQALLSAESTIPFDLEKAPLLRVKLVEDAHDRFDLIFTMHHIVSDGWSLEVLQREFLVLYETYKTGGADELAPMRIQYKDYAAWHNRQLADETRMAAAKDFWKEQLSGELPVLELPYAAALVAEGNKSSENLSAGYRSVLPEHLTMELRRLGKQQNASLFMVLLAGFHLLLLKITGQEEQMIGVPGAARQHDDLHDIIGLFVNTMILRNRTAADEPFVDLLHRVQEKMVQVLEYQGIPLESICGELKIKYPELAVFFNMFSMGDAGKKSLTEIGGAYHIAEVQQAKFPMVWYLTEYRDGVEINVHYKKELFKPATIEKIVRRYCRELENVVKGTTVEAGAGIRTEQKRRIRRGEQVNFSI